jgi:putative sigma-54 modulation protein
VQVAITCRHGSVRDDVQAVLTKKAEKLLTYFERVTQIQVTIDFGKDGTGVEILVDAEHRHDFIGADRNEDVLAAFDGAFHKVEQQIKKYKEKVQDHRRDVPISNLTNGPAEEQSASEKEST